MTHQSKCPSPPYHLLLTHSSLTPLPTALSSTSAICPMTHPLNCILQLSIPSLTLLHLLQHVIRVISVSTSPVPISFLTFIFTSPLCPKAFLSFQPDLLCQAKLLLFSYFCWRISLFAIPSTLTPFCLSISLSPITPAATLYLIGNRQKEH